MTHKILLEGKVAIITDGASGIGATTVRIFVENGAEVVIADIQDEQGEEISTNLGENAHYIHDDVSKEDDVKNPIDAKFSRFGHLDIMYNNAGVYDVTIKSILDTKADDLERMCKNLAVELGLHGIRVNCISPFAISSSSKVDDEIVARFE
ncbi:hypothetical protein HAX54_042131 [Datura stramonium]|uniref:Uncharacterized protein n=1 Tax=Datura stramonium TaxID=4076 RepID=A0ABS8SLN6_DATST|nr:hypothetical protein [Datura stramonium]